MNKNPKKAEKTEKAEKAEKAELTYLFIHKVEKAEKAELSYLFIHIKGRKGRIFIFIHTYKRPKKAEKAELSYLFTTKSQTIAELHFLYTSIWMYLQLYECIHYYMNVF